MRFLLVFCASCATLHAEPRTCPSANAIVVDTANHKMLLCESGHPVRELSVALGGGGIGKQREGDRKTPLGSYSLAEPRQSEKFHTFIEVGYPTADQRAAGLTGGDVGIHGPSRKRAWLGRLRNFFDWTDGCIAVATDDEIDAVAAWVRASKTARVVIE